MIKSEKKYTHNNHTILVCAEQFDADSRWSISIIVTSPNGEKFPTIKNYTESYQNKEDAFNCGFEIGKSHCNP